MQPVRAARFLHELSETLNDWRYNIRTAGWLPPDRTGVSRADAHDYAATPYRVIRRLFRSVAASGFDGTFVDYGCGRGRMTIMAAARPFSRVIGVELSVDLRAAALANLARARVSRRSPVEIVAADAAEFELPDDATVLFFYNPFGTGTMNAVAERIVRSLARRSRTLWVLAYNPPILEEAMQERLQLHVVARGRTVYPTIEWSVFRINP
jgi:predicted RNA methylase